MTGLNRIPIGQRERSFQQAEDKMGMLAFFDLFPLKKGIQCLYICKGLKNGSCPDLDKLFVNLVSKSVKVLFLYWLFLVTKPKKVAKPKFAKPSRLSTVYISKIRGMQAHPLFCVECQ